MAKTRISSSTACTWILIVIGALAAAALLIYEADGFDPAPLPDDSYSWFSSFRVPSHNDHVLQITKKIADGLLLGPEDLAYDANQHLLYTGCDDGWIKQVRLSGTVASMSVENWAYVGGRPIGLAIGAPNQLIVADAFKGLLRVTQEGGVEQLTDEAEGVKFGLTNCVDVAGDGMIYFTDTSHKYKLGEHMMDFLEGRPYGRLLSFNPYTNQTQVLLRDLYFANGLALSPQNDFLVFCESTLRRCRKYKLKGERKGSVENFIDNLPGFPDNILYDGEGHFWIALPSGRTFPLYLLTRYPSLRKAFAIWERFMKTPDIYGYGGMLGVSLEGKPVALYTDRDLVGVTSGVKIGKQVYFGSLIKNHISRFDINQTMKHLSSEV